jgi:adenylate cyclase class 2
MAIEVEQKYALSDAPGVEQRLIELGARPAELQGQLDRYYAHPQRDFATTDEALRLRRVAAHNYITYKGPKLDATSKTRREIEIALEPGEETARDADALLRAVGFRPVTEVRKQRQRFWLAWQGYEVEVALDDVAEVGQFVELEIVVDEQDRQQAQAALAALADRLELHNSERRSYLELLLAQRGAG